jgi:integrase/recombinase XerD
MHGHPTLNIEPQNFVMTSDDLYGYGKRLKEVERLIEADEAVRDGDRKLIQSFLRHIKAKNVSVGRQAKYAHMLRRCAQLVSVPFRDARRKDIEELVTKLSDYEFVVERNGKPRRYSPATMSDFRLTIKVFVKFVRYGDTDKETPYPDEVRWLRKDIKLSEKKQVIFYHDGEIEAMIRAADNYRDKAILAVEGELGLRTGELLGLRVGDVAIDDFGALLNVERGKTGPRRLRSIAAVQYLAEYLANHPQRDDPGAPLWVTRSTSFLGQPLKWVALSRMVRATAKKAGIVKPRAYPYMLRHGSATRNAKHLTDSELKLMYGWSMGSRMPAVYVHLSGGDLDEKYRQVYGTGKPLEPPKPSFAPTVCPRCREMAAPGMLYCPKCAAPLDETERAKMRLQEQTSRNEISELKALLEKYLHPQASEAETESSQGRPS